MSQLSRRFTAPFDGWRQRRAGVIRDQIDGTVRESVRDEMRELARMLRQQGDAADEMAETFGRTLSRLAVAIETLNERLDRLEGLERPS